MTPFVAEYIGTAIMILMGGGVVANAVLEKTKGNNSGWIVITTAWAMGVFIGVVVAGPYSGAHLNPAISIGLAVAGTFPWSNVLSYVVAQFLGAATGALMVWMFYKDHFDITENKVSKLGVFCTVPEIRNPFRNFLSEVIGTFVLMLVVFYITKGEAQMLNEKVTIPIGLGSVGAIPVAFTVWVIGLSLGGTTGYAINPARDLAPRFMHTVLPIKDKGGSQWSYSWVPLIGPLLGSTLAAMLYLILLD